MTRRVIVVTMDVPATVTHQQLADRVQRIMCQAATPAAHDQHQRGMTWPDAASIETTVYPAPPDEDA